MRALSHLFLVLNLSLTSSLGWAEDSDSCKYQSYAEGNWVPSSEVIQNLLQAKRPEVVILGENHFHSGTMRIHHLVDEIIQGAPGRYCVFLEFNPNLHFDFIMQLGLYKDLRATAKQWGAEFVLVDEEKNYQKNDNYLNVSRRNENMSENIAKALSAGRCEKGIYIVGKAHNYTVLNNQPIRSVQKLLESNHGYSVVSIDVVDSFWFQEGKRGRTEFPTPTLDIVQGNRWDLIAGSCPDREIDWMGKTRMGFLHDSTMELCETPIVEYTVSTPKRTGAVPDFGKWGRICDFDGVIVL